LLNCGLIIEKIVDFEREIFIDIFSVTFFSLTLLQSDINRERIMSVVNVVITLAVIVEVMIADVPLT